MWSSSPKFSAASGLGRGDDIPPRTPAADVIERGKAAGDMIRLVERGRTRCDQADMFGGHQRAADSSVNGSKEVTVWLRLSAEIGMFSHGQMVGHEEASNCRPPVSESAA